MKNKILVVLVFIFFGLYTINSFGQNPNWSINPTNYQFSANYTTSLNVFGASLKSSNDKVAAFVNGEIRGVANVVYQPNADKYVAYLTVFANTNNETINFKMYSTNFNAVVDAKQTAIFKIDDNVGNIFQSFVLSNETLSDKAILGDFNFVGISPINKKVYRNINSDPSLFSTITPYPTDPNRDVFEFLLPNGTDVNNLMPDFYTLYKATVFINRKKQVSSIVGVDFSQTVVYQVLSEDETVVVETKIIVNVANNIYKTNAILNSITVLNVFPKIIDVKFTNPVNNFNADAFVLTNAVISKLIKTDTQNYKIELMPISEGDFSIAVDRNSIIDLDNFPLVSDNGPLNFTNDETQPIITNLELKNDNGSEYFDVTFSEPVINLGILDFELTGTLAQDYFIASQVSLVANNNYRIDISKTGTKEGSVFLKVKTDSDITDIFGNKLLLQEIQSFFTEKTPPKTIVLPDIIAECAVTVTDVQDIPVTTDAISGQITATTKDSLTYTEQGEYVLNWHFTDDAGNTTTIPQKIIINDETKPKVRAINFELELNSAGNATLIASDIDDGSTDNCGIASYNLSKTNFTEANLGENDVVFTVTDINGNSDFVNIKITVTQEALSIDNLALINLIQLYPNPVNTKLFLKIDEEVKINKIKIFSVDGKTILSSNKSQDFIDVKHFAIGVYFIKINTEKGVFLKKFLKIKR